VHAAAQTRRRFQLQANAKLWGAEMIAEAGAAVEALGLGIDTNDPLPQRWISPRKGTRSKGARLSIDSLSSEEDEIPAHKIKRQFATDAEDTPLAALNEDLNELQTHYVDVGGLTQQHFKLLKMFQRFDRKRDGTFAIRDLSRMVNRGDKDLLDLLQVPERLKLAGFGQDPESELMQLFSDVDLEEDEDSMQFVEFQGCFEKYWYNLRMTKAALIIQSMFHTRKAYNFMHAEKTERFRLMTILLKEKRDADRAHAALVIQNSQRLKTAQQKAENRRLELQQGKAIEEQKQEAIRQKKEEQQRANAILMAQLESRRQEAEKKKVDANKAAMLARRASINKVVERRTSIVQASSPTLSSESDHPPVEDHLNVDAKIPFGYMPKRKMKVLMSDEEMQALKNARTERNEATIMLLAELRGSNVQPRFRTRPGKEPGQAKGAPDAGTSWLLHMKKHAKNSSTTSIGGSVTELGSELLVPQFPTPPTGPSMSQTPRHRSQKVLGMNSNRAKSVSPRTRNRRNVHSAPPVRQDHQNPFLANPSDPPSHTMSRAVFVKAGCGVVQGSRPTSAVYSKNEGRMMKPLKKLPPREPSPPPGHNNNATEDPHEPLILPQIPARRMLPSFGKIRQPYPSTPPIPGGKFDM